jgi:hypothetical protein
MIERLYLYLVMVIFTVFLVAFPWPAIGHEFRCFPPNIVERTLENEWNEAVVAQGMMSKGKVLVQVWRSATGKTFSITYTNLAGQVCLLLYGNDYLDVLWYLPTGRDS